MSPSRNLAKSLTSYRSLFHRWLNTFSLTSSVFSLFLWSPPLLSQSFTLLQLTIFFLAFSFLSLTPYSSDLSILISIFLLFTVETSALTRETARRSNKQRGYRARWRATPSPYLKSWPKDRDRQATDGCGKKYNHTIIKWKAKQLNEMYSEILQNKQSLRIRFRKINSGGIHEKG